MTEDGRRKAEGGGFDLEDFDDPFSFWLRVES